MVHGEWAGGRGHLARLPSEPRLSTPVMWSSSWPTGLAGMGQQLHHTSIDRWGCKWCDMAGAIGVIKAVLDLIHVDAERRGRSRSMATCTSGF